MPEAPPQSSADDEESPERNRRLLIVLGALGALSAVVAGVVIFSGSGSRAPAEDPVAPTSASGESLVVGRPGAPATVVVFEDFGDPASREFEMGSRDFLKFEAARGDLRVEYHPVALAGDSFSSGALAAWGGVLRVGPAAQALAYHDLLFDRQPSPATSAPGEFISLARRAGVTSNNVLDAVAAPDHAWLAAVKQAAASSRVGTTPTVLVDGRPLTASSPTALADRLQRLLLTR